MDKPDPGVAFLSSIGFSITNRCPIACRHCIIEAGPHRREEMDLSDATCWMQQAAAYRNGHIKSVVITGGEPFYNPTLLTALLRCSLACGLVPAVVTNAFWAPTLKAALQTLRELPRIAMLTISTDEYHQRFIPVANVRNALRAALALEIPHSVAVCYANEKDVAYRELIAEIQQIVPKELIRSAATFPAGRAAKNLDLARLETRDEYTAGPCSAADFPTIFPDGKVIGCMGIVKDLPRGHPLRLGSLRESALEAILDDSESNTVLHILRVWGAGKLLRLLQAAGFGDRLPRQYLDSGYCELCYTLTHDDELLNGLATITRESVLAESTAYARLYYLNETMMLERLKIRPA